MIYPLSLIISLCTVVCFAMCMHPSYAALQEEEDLERVQQKVNNLQREFLCKVEAKEPPYCLVGHENISLIG